MLPKPIANPSSFLLFSYNLGKYITSHYFDSLHLNWFNSQVPDLHMIIAKQIPLFHSKIVFSLQTHKTIQPIFCQTLNVSDNRDNVSCLTCKQFLLCYLNRSLIRTECLLFKAHFNIFTMHELNLRSEFGNLLSLLTFLAFI